MDTLSLLYFGAIAVWSAWIAYLILFAFRKPQPEPDTPVEVPFPAAPVPPRSVAQVSVEGFKAFQTGAELTVEDIVKGLSRRS